MTATNESIRRAHPTIDSPLARWIKGEIDDETYYIQMNAKRARHGLPPVDATTHPLAPRRSPG
jgi:hypothetical protein